MSYILSTLQITFLLGFYLNFPIISKLFPYQIFNISNFLLVFPLSPILASLTGNYGLNN